METSVILVDSRGVAVIGNSISPPKVPQSIAQMGDPRLTDLFKSIFMEEEHARRNSAETA